MTDAAPLLSDLIEARSSEITDIYRDDGRALCAAIAFHRSNAKSVLKRRAQFVAQLLGTYHDKTQTSKVFGIAASYIALQERRRGKKNRCPVLCRECADDTRVQRIGMIDCPHSSHQR